MIYRRRRVCLIVLSCIALGAATMGSARAQGDYCVSTVTGPGGSTSGIEGACFQTGDELTKYMRQGGVEVPDGLYDHDFGVGQSGP